MLDNVTPMILAAGHATRLRPLSSRRAKAVVPFLNRPLLDHTLSWLARSGFRRVVINLHHAGDTVVRAYGRKAFGMRIEYSPEPVLLGTAGGPRRALDLLDETVLLVNGDVVALMSLGPLLQHHRESGALATLALYGGEAGEAYPQVTASASGRLLAFPGDEVPAGESAAVKGVFTGLHLVEKAVLAQVPQDVPAGIVDPVYRGLLASGNLLRAINLPGVWYEVGDPVRYIDCQLRALEIGDVPLSLDPRGRRHVAGYASEHAQLQSARPRPPYLIGAGVRLRHGSRLEGVVLGDRTRVEAGCRLRRVVTWKDSWIARGADLHEVVVMQGVRVPAGTVASQVAFTAGGPVAFGSDEAEAAS